MSHLLEGIRVLAVTQYGAGPFAMLQLADLGAEVIKIENPLTDGDVSRTVPPYLEKGVNDSIYFQAFNRNNKSVTLNLQDPRGVEALHRLVRVSDGLFSNLRGDLPTRMRLRYRDLKAINRAIVTCHLSGYGLDNVRSARPSYDHLIQAETGVMSVTGEPGRLPQRCGVSVIDFAGGYNAAFGLTAGMLKARITGEGCDLDVSLYDTSISMLNYLAAWHLSRDYEAVRQPNSGHPTQVPSGAFPTADGSIMIMCAKEEFFARLCEVLGHPEWTGDPRFLRFADRLRHREEVWAMLNQEFKRKTTREWLELMGTRVPCAPINDFATALADPFINERGMLVRMEHPVFGEIVGMGSALKVDEEPRFPHQLAPCLGQHTDEVLTGLAKYSLDEVQNLRAQKVV